MPETAIATTAALAALAVNGAAAAFAGLRWWQVRASDAVWPLLRAGQLAAVGQALCAGALALAGYEPGDGLYWLYALLPVAIGFVAEQLRVAAAEQVLEDRDLPDAQAVGALPADQQHSVVLAVVRREMGIMALAALTVSFLALRAALIA